ncbi:DUF885 domain-containing protein [Actinoplanes sp. NPDC024001]|uniref:DUF885 domain-containing protein n=1 Tax=Actinoplanes sp. NPDC024001 TaxID=3154598 RepID=UPI0033C01F76
MSHDLAQRCLTFVWENQPDAAVEAGHLPPVPWEAVNRERRAAALAKADELIAELRAAPGDDPVTAVALYHVTCTRSLVARCDIGILNHMTGPVGRLAWAADMWPMGLDPAAERFAERLAAFPAYCDEVAAEVAGTQGSRPVLEAFLAQVDSLIGDLRAGKEPLSRPFTDAGREVPAGLMDGALAGLTTLREVAVAALPSAAEASPMPGRPDGAEWYAEATYTGASLALTPDELEKLGRQILDRSRARFIQLRDEGYADVPAFATGNDYLERVRVVHARLVEALPRIIDTVPETPSEVVAMPEAHALVGPPAFYGPSSKANGRPGYLYVNGSEPHAREWEVLPLAMHEGVPGHHLQLALLDENEALPEVLRLLMVNAFTEGWAVYSERLTAEMGIEVSPLEEFGLLAHQRWRAARLVIDVGLHVRGWSIDEAVAFMVAEVGIDPEAVRREVVRYVAWPGQALGYAVGAEIIADWVAARVRDGVPLATAHAELLRMGSVPLSSLKGSS